MAWSPAIMLMSSDEDQGYRDGLEGREPRPIWSTYKDGYDRGVRERERKASRDDKPNYYTGGSDPNSDW